MENVRRLRAAGVRLVAGTDAPNPGTGAGISMHGELRLLARAGMGSAEALAAATSVAADAFGVAERGRIAEGHLADLVLVRGDLEEDVSRSHDIVAIWKDGYLADRAIGSGAGLQAEIAPAPAETLVADFEDGFEASFGAWDVTTDQLTGGSSTADVAVRDGALVVTGEIASGLPFPWAGVILDARRAAHAARGLLRAPGDPLPHAGGWAAVLGDADRQRGAGRAATHRDVRRARGVDPSGDPAGRLPDGDTGSHCGAGVCGGGAGWGLLVRGG